MIFSVHSALPGASENPENDDRTGNGDDQVAEETLVVQAENACQRAADERAGDADKDVGEEAVVTVHRLLGDIAGDKADKEHAEEADARHSHDSDALFHLQSLLSEASCKPSYKP